MNQDIVNKVIKFRDDRNWRQFHNPKDLAISINIEAAELLELFQWTGAELECPEKREEMAEELADVLIYCIMMADSMGLNVNEIIEKKLIANEAKYTIKASYNSKEKPV